MHAEAWARRIVAAGGEDLRLLVQRIDEMWAQAARWPGPDSDPGYGEAIAAGMVDSGPAAIRRRVRDWLGPRVAGVSFDEPTDWSDWDAAVPPITCPFCDSADVELVAPWGGQIITSQMRCRACNTYFEAIRDDFEARHRHG